MEPQNLGFETWLDVYEYLKGIGFEQEARVGFIIPPVIRSVVENQNFPTVKAEPSEYILEMAQIRALAFDELYERLPLKKSQEVVFELADDVAEQLHARPDMQPILDFIHKTPTRNK